MYKFDGLLERRCLSAFLFTNNLAIYLFREVFIFFLGFFHIFLIGIGLFFFANLLFLC